MIDSTVTLKPCPFCGMLEREQALFIAGKMLLPNGIADIHNENMKEVT